MCDILQNKQLVLFWVFLGFFLIIGVISLLSIIGVLKIEDRFRKWAITGFIVPVVGVIIAMAKIFLTPVDGGIQSDLHVAIENTVSLTKMKDDTLSAKTPAEVKSAVEVAAKDLLNRGLIDNSGYRYMLRDVENLQSMIDAQTKARKIIGYFAGIAGIAYGGRRAAETFF
jgi:hypothetical protein